MPVYVDSMTAQYGRMVMCHMVADSRAELDAMADAIGVQRKWIQHERKPSEHYDICKSKRAKAVALGAIELGRAEFVAKLRAKRGPNPASAVVTSVSTPSEGEK
ncbi:MAG TPA: DUF4031 domain-containing protein [Streptosporangiaceae bacterium]